jgi:hypothetical protein
LIYGAGMKKNIAYFLLLVAVLVGFQGYVGYACIIFGVGMFILYLNRPDSGDINGGDFGGGDGGGCGGD